MPHLLLPRFAAGAFAGAVGYLPRILCRPCAGAAAPPATKRLRSAPPARRLSVSRLKGPDHATAARRRRRVRRASWPLDVTQPPRRPRMPGQISERLGRVRQVPSRSVRMPRHRIRETVACQTGGRLAPCSRDRCPVRMSPPCAPSRCACSVTTPATRFWRSSFALPGSLGVSSGKRRLGASSPLALDLFLVLVFVPLSARFCTGRVGILPCKRDIRNDARDSSGVATSNLRPVHSGLTTAVAAFILPGIGRHADAAGHRHRRRAMSAEPRRTFDLREANASASASKRSGSGRRSIRSPMEEDSGFPASEIVAQQRLARMRALAELPVVGPTVSHKFPSRSSGNLGSARAFECPLIGATRAAAILAVLLCERQKDRRGSESGP